MIFFYNEQNDIVAFAKVDNEQEFISEALFFIDDAPTNFYDYPISCYCFDGGRIKLKQNYEQILADFNTEQERLAVEKLRKSMVISPRQARLALLEADLLDAVEALLSTNKDMQIWWEYSLDIRRDNEHIITMASALGLSEEQLDNLFIDGAKL